MADADVEQAKRLDLDGYLDALVSGAPAPPTQMDPCLVATVQTLHALAATPPPATAASRVWREMTDRGAFAVPPREQAGSDFLPQRPFRLATRKRWQPWTALATAALLLLTLLGGVVTFRLAAPRVPGSGASLPRVFVTSADNGSLIPLDPTTLRDLPGGAPIQAATPAPASPAAGQAQLGEWFASRDGGTLVRIETSTNTAKRVETILVVDARSGHVLARIPLQGTPVENTGAFSAIAFPPVRPTLSASGRRFMLETPGTVVSGGTVRDVSHNTPPKFDIYDLATGHHLSTIQSVDPAPSLDQSGWLDPTGQRLYHLVVANTSGYPGPWPVQLVVNDTATGAEVGRLPLRDVLASYWTTPDGRYPQSVDFLVPGVAMAADGSRLAFVHGDGLAATLVDTRPLKVLRTIRFTSNPATPVPLPGETSTETGRRWFAVFAPDGQHVYIHGLGNAADASGKLFAEDFGLARVNLATGAVEARVPIVLPPVFFPTWIQPAPDGSSVYVQTPRYTNIGTPGAEPQWLLERLDARTLKPLAERNFTGRNRQFFVWPARAGEGHS